MQNKDTTILFYCLADNNISQPEHIQYLKATFQQIIGANYSNINTLLYIDYKAGAESEFPGTPQLYKNGDDMHHGVPKPEWEKSGSLKTIRQFIDYGKEQFPANRYFLFFMDHGGGLFFGEDYRKAFQDFLVSLNSQFQDKTFILDETNPIWEQWTKDFPLLNIDETKKVVTDNAVQDKSSFLEFFKAVQIYKPMPRKPMPRKPRPHAAVGEEQQVADADYKNCYVHNLGTVMNPGEFDLVAVEACFMAMVENAFSLRGKSNYLLASQEGMDWNGFNYAAFLSKLNETPAQSVADVYHNLQQGYAAQPEVEMPAYSRTVSLLRTDLAAMENWRGVFNATLDLVLANKRTELPLLMALRKGLFSYYSDMDTGGYFVDLLNVLINYKTATANADIKTKLDALIAATQALVVNNYKALDNGTQAGQNRDRKYGSFGLSIYLPDDKTIYDTYWDNDLFLEGSLLPFTNMTRWGELLAAFVA